MHPRIPGRVRRVEQDKRPVEQELRHVGRVLHDVSLLRVVPVPPAVVPDVRHVLAARLLHDPQHHKGKHLPDSRDKQEDPEPLVDLPQVLVRLPGQPQERQRVHARPKAEQEDPGEVIVVVPVRC